jgi:hypothetical protein
MKGIYLTREAKQEIEAKIAELEKQFLISENDLYAGMINALEEILSSATILPVEDEETHEDIWLERFTQGVYDTAKKSYLEQYYPNGVIIQPKQ